MASPPYSYRAGMAAKTVEEAQAAIAWWKQAEPAEVVAPADLRPAGLTGQAERPPAAWLAERDAAVAGLRRRIAGLAASYERSSKAARKPMAAALASWHIAIGFADVPELCSLPPREAQERWHLVVIEAETALFYKPRLPDALALRGLAESRRFQFPEALATFTQASAFPLATFQVPQAQLALSQGISTCEPSSIPSGAAAGALGGWGDAT